MRQNRQSYVIAALLTLPPSCRRRRAQSNSRIITFQDAIGIALEQNTTVRQAQNAAALGKVGVSEAQSQFLPDLRFSTTGSKNYGRSFDQTEGTIVDQTHELSEPRREFGRHAVRWLRQHRDIERRAAQRCGGASRSSIARVRRWRSPWHRIFCR